MPAPAAAASAPAAPAAPAPAPRYSEMKLEDYAPYKALNLPLGLFGPAPRRPSSCICGRYIVDNYCACASECWKMPQHTHFQAHPEEYIVQQEEERSWLRRYQYWIDQRTKVEEKIWRASKSVVQEFERLQDQESTLGCFSCESHGAHRCSCFCDSCGSKYCSGDCAGDQEYL